MYDTAMKGKPLVGKHPQSMSQKNKPNTNKQTNKRKSAEEKDV